MAYHEACQGNPRFRLRGSGAICGYTGEAKRARDNHPSNMGELIALVAELFFQSSSSPTTTLKLVKLEPDRDTFFKRCLYFGIARSIVYLL